MRKSEFWGFIRTWLQGCFCFLAKDIYPKSPGHLLIFLWIPQFPASSHCFSLPEIRTIIFLSKNLTNLSPVHLLEKSPVHLFPVLFFANQLPFSKFFLLSLLLLDIDRSEFFFLQKSHKFKPSPFTEKQAQSIYSQPFLSNKIKRSKWHWFFSQSIKM